MVQASVDRSHRHPAESIVLGKSISRCLNGDHHCHWICRGFCKSKFLVKSLRALADRMNENCPNAGYFSGLDGSEDSILQECRTDSMSLEFEVDGQTPDHHHRHGVGHIPLHTARSIPVRRRACGQCIVAHNSPPDANDIGPGCAAFLIVKCSAFEPVVKLRLTTSKLRKIVDWVQFFRSGKFPNLYFSHGAFVLSKRVNPGLSAGGASSMAVKRWNASSSSWK